MPTTPTPPIELGGADQHLEGTWVPVKESVAESLSSICRVTRLEGNELAVAELSRDWWPLALHWALAGEVGALAAVVVHPTSTEEVSQVMSVCHDAVIPVTAAGGRSGVCGGSIPVHGGVVIDLSEMNSIIEVDEVSGIITAQCGVFGPDLEHFLRSEHSITVGHHPQSFDLSTVGGWVACRGAGQYSTRYGKIEEMVVGLEVVLADGSIIHTGGHAAGAVGPDLNHVFIGSEGTLGIITSATLRTHPASDYQGRATYSFPTLSDAFEACRLAIRHEATPAVLRLYDPIESARSHGGDGEETIVLVLDEGHQRIVDATLATVDEFFVKCGGSVVEHDRVEHWLEHRNDTTALQGLTKKRFVIDTMEVTVPWSKLDAVYQAVRDAALSTPHAVSASAHLSHSYLDGACLYFSLASRPPRDTPLPEIDAIHRTLWDESQRAALRTGANLSHHHGVGLNRSRYMHEALGSAFNSLQHIKDALDPHGIMNPGKMGFVDKFGTSGW